MSLVSHSIYTTSNFTIELIIKVTLLICKCKQIIQQDGRVSNFDLLSRISWFDGRHDLELIGVSLTIFSLSLKGLRHLWVFWYLFWKVFEKKVKTNISAGTKNVGYIQLVDDTWNFLSTIVIRRKNRLDYRLSETEQITLSYGHMLLKPIFPMSLSVYWGQT